MGAGEIAESGVGSVVWGSVVWESMVWGWRCGVGENLEGGGELGGAGTGEDEGQLEISAEVEFWLILIRADRFERIQRKNENCEFGENYDCGGGFRA